MEAEESWPALETTPLIGVVAIGSKALAAAWQIPDRLVAAISDHGFVLWPSRPADAAHRQLAAIGAVDAVVAIDRIRALRIDAHRRKRRRDGRFRGIREIRSDGA